MLTHPFGVWQEIYIIGALLTFFVLPLAWGENKQRFPASGPAFFAWALGTAFWFLLLIALVAKGFMALMSFDLLSWGATSSFGHVPDMSALNWGNTFPVPPVPSLAMLEGEVSNS